VFFAERNDAWGLWGDRQGFAVFSPALPSVFPSSGQTPPFVPDEAFEVVSEIGHADLELGPGHADGSDEHAHAPLLMGEDMLDAGADSRSSGVGLGLHLAQRLAGIAPVMDLRVEATLGHVGFVLPRTVCGIRPYPRCRVVLAHQVPELGSVMSSGIAHRE